MSHKSVQDALSPVVESPIAILSDRLLMLSVQRLSKVLCRSARRGDGPTCRKRFVESLCRSAPCGAYIVPILCGIH